MTSLPAACRFTRVRLLPSPGRRVEAGKIRVLAVTNTTRRGDNPRHSDRRRGRLFRALTMDGLVGLFGPPGMPDGAA